jgi:galactosamine-6-phosphate isomerase
MEIHIAKDYDELSKLGADIIIGELKKKSAMLLCAATGESPKGVYGLLKHEHTLRPELFDNLHVIKLDEWGGLTMNNPATCEYYLQEFVVQPLTIPDENYISFQSDSQEPYLECGRVQKKLDKSGPPDLCILGLGINGHIGLNEPAEVLTAGCHVAEIAESSRHHSMLADLRDKPVYGLTMGIADILLSRRILLLINGPKKKGIVQKLLSRQITCNVPASLLWLHHHVDCIIQEDAYPEPMPVWV